MYKRQDLVEPFGIDESWLDVTGTLHLFGGDAVALADRLRERMRGELGLTISVGVSFNLSLIHISGRDEVRLLRLHRP